MEKCQKGITSAAMLFGLNNHNSRALILMMVRGDICRVVWWITLNNNRECDSKADEVGFSVFYSIEIVVSYRLAISGMIFSRPNVAFRVEIYQSSFNDFRCSVFHIPLSVSQFKSSILRSVRKYI